MQMFLPLESAQSSAPFSCPVLLGPAWMVLDHCKAPCEPAGKAGAAPTFAARDTLTSVQGLPGLLNKKTEH